jgi:hypothetical protein
MTRTHSTALLSLSMVGFTFGACKCDDELARLPGGINGIVCSADTGAGVPNVTIIVKDANGKTHEVLTGDDGSFRLDKIAAGKAEVTIESPDGVRNKEVTVLSDTDAEIKDESCHPPIPPPVPVGTIEGCLCDESEGAWVAQGNAYVLTPEGGIYSAPTNDLGCFSLPNVPIGLRQVQIEKGLFYEIYDVDVPDGGVVAIAPNDLVCEPLPPPPDGGTVEGRVCAPDGETWLSDASVYVVREDGTRATATTDADGNYVLEGVPPGTQTVHVEKGSFSSTFEVDVVSNETTVVPDAECELLPPDLRIAVVDGAYDQVEDVLGSLGIDPANVTMYDGEIGFFPGGNIEWVGELLGDYATLAQYDVVFFNCGVDDAAFTTEKDQVAIDNLRQFVAQGGSVYASDWAYDIVETTWPNYIDFERTDTLGDSAQVGVSEATIPGTIVDANLAAAMGQTTINMDYPLDIWAVMSAVDAGVTVYVRGNARVHSGFSEQTRTNIPHTVGFSPGGGRVLYTSFHQEPGINLDQQRILQLLMFEL